MIPCTPICRYHPFTRLTTMVFLKCKRRRNRISESSQSLPTKIKKTPKKDPSKHPNKKSSGGCRGSGGLPLPDKSVHVAYFGGQSRLEMLNSELARAQVEESIIAPDSRGPHRRGVLGDSPVRPPPVASNIVACGA